MVAPKLDATGCQVDPNSPPTAAEGAHGVAALGAILGEITVDTSSELSLYFPPSLHSCSIYDQTWRENRPRRQLRGRGELDIGYRAVLYRNLRPRLLGVCSTELLLVDDEPDEISLEPVETTMGRDLCNIPDRIGQLNDRPSEVLLRPLPPAHSGWRRPGSTGCCRRLAHCIGRVGRGRAGEVRCSSLFEPLPLCLCGRRGGLQPTQGGPEALGGILHGSSLQTTSFQSVLHGATVPCGSGRHQPLASLPQGGPDFAMHATPAGGTTAK